MNLEIQRVNKHYLKKEKKKKILKIRYITLLLGKQLLTV